MRGSMTRPGFGAPGWPFRNEHASVLLNDNMHFAGKAITEDAQKYVQIVELTKLAGFKSGFQRLLANQPRIGANVGACSMPISRQPF
jgi:hypothetical protein